MAPETPESFAEKRFQRVSSRTVARASNHLVLSRGWHERPRGPTRFIRSDTSNLPQRYSSMPSQRFQRFGSSPVCHKSPAILPILFLDSGVPWRLTPGMFAIGSQRHWCTDLTPLNGTTSREIIRATDAAPILMPAGLLAMQGRRWAAWHSGRRQAWPADRAGTGGPWTKIIRQMVSTSGRSHRAG